MNNKCCEEPKKLYEEDGVQWEFCGNCLEPYNGGTKDDEDNEGSE